MIDPQTKARIEASGFKIDATGNIRNQQGHMVSKAAAEQVIAGNIVGNISLDEIKKAKARKAATGNVNLVDALNEISPAIAVLGVGQVAKIPMPTTSTNGKNPKRQFVMSIVTKLNNITAKGREWAGRRFDTVSGDDGFLYVGRLHDGEAKERLRGGGRRKKEATNSLSSALDRAKEKLAGGEGEVLQPDGIVIEHNRQPENA